MTATATDDATALTHLRELAGRIPAVRRPKSASRFLGASCAMMAAYDRARAFLAGQPVEPAAQGGEALQLIEILREGEGASVTLLCDNPGPDGPNNAIEIADDWTDWQPVRFTGETLTHALRAAIGREGGVRIAAEPFRQGPLTFLPLDGEACRGCGCTESKACMTQAGACGWARPQICTACLEVVGRVLGEPAIRFLQLACGVVTPGASSSRPGANNLTAADVLQLRDVFTACLELIAPSDTAIAASTQPDQMIDSECIHPDCGCGEGPCKATGGTARPGSPAHG